MADKRKIRRARKASLEATSDWVGRLLIGLGYGRQVLSNSQQETSSPCLRFSGVFFVRQLRGDGWNGHENQYDSDREHYLEFLAHRLRPDRFN